jgi:anaerobic selenocysteine-containing dehydrogenase
MSNSPKSCGSSVSRRDFLNVAAVGGCAVVAASMAGSAYAAPKKKFSQQQAHYQPIPKSGNRCQTCALYQAPAACQQVDGQISPAGWCMLYQQKG